MLPITCLAFCPSLSEQVEALESRALGDTDAVTFAARPVNDIAQWKRAQGASLSVATALDISPN
jgi:hypothetical protein